MATGELAARQRCSSTSVAVPSWARGSTACALTASESDESLPATPYKPKTPTDLSTVPADQSETALDVSSKAVEMPQQSRPPMATSLFPVGSPRSPPARPRWPPAAVLAPQPSSARGRASEGRASEATKHQVYLRPTVASRASSRGKVPLNEDEPWRPAGVGYHELRDSHEKSPYAHLKAATSGGPPLRAHLEARLDQLEGKVSVLIADVMAGVEALIDAVPPPPAPPVAPPAPPPQPPPVPAVLVPPPAPADEPVGEAMTTPATAAAALPAVFQAFLEQQQQQPQAQVPGEMPAGAYGMSQMPPAMAYQPALYQPAPGLLHQSWPPTTMQGWPLSQQIWPLWPHQPWPHQQWPHQPWPHQPWPHQPWPHQPWPQMTQPAVRDLCARGPTPVAAASAGAGGSASLPTKARSLSRSAPWHRPPWEDVANRDTPGPGKYDPREMLRISFNARFAPNEEHPGYGRFVARPLAPRPGDRLTKPKAKGHARAPVTIVAR
jgi:hypothetical protein